jgi:hypothetical protein
MIGKIPSFEKHRPIEPLSGTPRLPSDLAQPLLDLKLELD